MQPLPNTLAITSLALIATIFGANHVAARVTFDHGTGILLAIAARSGLATLVLLAVVMFRKIALDVPAEKRGLIALTAGLIATQSACIYLAVARVPVAIALLVFNLFPLFFVMLTWALNGTRPARAVLWMVPIIFFGLALVLDVPALLRGLEWTPQFTFGILSAFGAAVAFSSVLWLTENKLDGIDGALRTLLLQGLVTVIALVIIATQFAPKLVAFPRDQTGWIALLLLATIYAIAFSILFVMMPRLNLARNAPALNVEPVATLFLGWAILGQSFNGTQTIGAAVVVVAIIVMSVFKK